MRAFLAALQFLTAIPVRMFLTEEDFERAPFWFPLAGLTLGLITALADYILAHWGFPPLLLSLVSIGVLAALSGGLHLDGLADTADGFLSARPRERVLEIMRDSRIGTMGVLALIFVLGVKVAALAELEGALRWQALLLAPMAGRCMQLAVLNTMPYARKESGGLATLFLSRDNPFLYLWAILWLAAVSFILRGFAGGLMITVVLGIITIGLSQWSKRRIGGFTGDTLGATSEIIEAAVFVLLAV